MTNTIEDPEGYQDRRRANLLLLYIELGRQADASRLLKEQIPPDELGRVGKTLRAPMVRRRGDDDVWAAAEQSWAAADRRLVEAGPDATRWWVQAIAEITRRAISAIPQYSTHEARVNYFTVGAEMNYEGEEPGFDMAEYLDRSLRRHPWRPSPLPDPGAGRPAT